MKHLPDDINVELLLNYFPPGQCRVAFQGMHKRNSYGDIIEQEERPDKTMRLTLGRKSLYNALPEYLFHPIDRFSNLPEQEKKERFAEEYAKQEQEKDLAHRFFYPADLLLLAMRMELRKRINRYVETNSVLINILADNLSEEQRSNRFIRQVLPMLPHCKDIRGNLTLLTFLLRKVFMEERLKLDVQTKTECTKDNHPRYALCVGDELGECYAGNQFDEQTIAFNLHCWDDEWNDTHFKETLQEIDQFRSFIQDFFLSVEEILVFDISTNNDSIILSDETHYNYLNYNSNL